MNKRARGLGVLPAAGSRSVTKETSEPGGAARRGGMKVRTSSLAGGRGGSEQGHGHLCSLSLHRGDTQEMRPPAPLPTRLSGRASLWPQCPDPTHPPSTLWPSPTPNLSPQASAAGATVPSSRLWVRSGAFCIIFLLVLKKLQGENNADQAQDIPLLPKTPFPNEAISVHCSDGWFCLCVYRGRAETHNRHTHQVVGFV